MGMKHTVQKAVARCGLEVRRRKPQLYSFDNLLKLYGVDMVFDIGANIGDSVEEFRRKWGYRGKIVSFEPVREMYEALVKATTPDTKCTAVNVALGDHNGEAEINVSGGDRGATSLLDWTDDMARRLPHKRPVRTETVKVCTIDSVVDQYYKSGDRLFLKIDVQGFERKVLEGARATLDRVVGLKVELSLSSSYKGDDLAWEMVPWLYSLGFRLTSLERGWTDRKTQELYQFDGIFFRVEQARGE